MGGLKIMPVNQGSDFENQRNSKNNQSVGVVGGKEYPQTVSGTAQDPPASSGFEPNTSELGYSRSDQHENEMEEEVMVETNISKLLSERTTKVVIIIVLVMLFFQPVFSSDTYTSDPGESD